MRLTNAMERQQRPFTPKPSHFRYLRAYVDVLESTGTVNMSTVARRMGISRQALWKIRARAPGLDRWVAEQLGARAAAYAGPVLQRLAVRALAGSVRDAELYLRVVGR